MCLLHLTGLNMWPLTLSAWKRARSCVPWMHVGNTKTTPTQGWSAKSRFIPSSRWLEDSKQRAETRRLLGLCQQGHNTVRPESSLHIKGGLEHVQIFTRLYFTISTLLISFPCLQRGPKPIQRMLLSLSQFYVILSENFTSLVDKKQPKQTQIHEFSHTVF